MAAVEKWVGRVVHHNEYGTDHVSVNVQLTNADGTPTGQALSLIFQSGKEPRVKTYLEVTAKEVPAPSKA